MRQKDRNKKKITLVLLLVLLIGVGYAALSTTLNINGVSTINKQGWNVHFANVVLNTNSVSTTTANAAQIDANNNKLVTYTVTLDEPGDFYEFTVDAVNEGTIDAMIDTIVSKMNGTDIDNNTFSSEGNYSYLDYSVTYSDDTAIAEHHALDHNSSETYKVRVEYKRDITTADLAKVPQNGITLNFEFGVEYVQGDNTKVARSTPVSANYAYSWQTSGISNEYKNSNTNRYENIPLSAIGTPLNSPEAAMAVQNKSFFLRYNYDGNNIIQESAVGFVIGNNGPYYLIGGHDESSSQEKTYYEANIDTLLDAFGSGECKVNGKTVSNNKSDYLSADWINCSNALLSAYAYAKGNVSAGAGDADCHINDDGNSRCYVNW